MTTKFIQLTKADEDGNDIWISVQHIVSIEPSDYMADHGGQSEVMFFNVGICGQQVKQSVYQIMSMIAETA